MSLQSPSSSRPNKPPCAVFEPVGESSFLLRETAELPTLEAFRRLRRAELPFVRDLAPGARSLLVVVEPEAEGAREALSRAVGAGVEPLEGAPCRLVEISVRYGGPDLDTVAARAGLPPEEVVRRHAAAEYEVAFVGFQPGFAYLRGLPTELATPRLASPRPRVPAGSVAIGASWTGIYPVVTPGGWNLIGTTSKRLFDAAASPPSLLTPGDRVRFLAE